MSDAAIAGVDEALATLRRDVHEATVIVGGTKPKVLLDGDDDTGSFSTGKAIAAVPTTDIPSTGQRVLVAFGTERGRPTAHVWIVGVIGGVQRNLGYGETSYEQAGITTEVTLEESAGVDLEVPIQILHPRRLVVLTAHVRVEATAGAPTPILRAKVTDDSGTTTSVGICDESPILAVGENIVLGGEAVLASPDPGEYTAFMTLANGGAGTVAILATGLESDTWLRVTDVGAHA